MNRVNQSVFQMKNPEDTNKLNFWRLKRVASVIRVNQDTITTSNTPLALTTKSPCLTLSMNYLMFLPANLKLEHIVIGFLHND